MNIAALLAAAATWLVAYVGCAFALGFWGSRSQWGLLFMRMQPYKTVGWLMGHLMAGLAAWSVFQAIV